jgi:hypothetical protein
MGSGSDLVIEKLGFEETTTIKDFFGTIHSLDEIEAGGLKLSISGIDSIVGAMTTYQEQNTSFSPSLAAVMPNDPTLESVSSYVWHP